MGRDFTVELYPHVDELGGPLPVARQGSNELGRQIAEGIAETRGSRAARTAQRSVPGPTVRQQQHGVAGRALAVDREAVVGPVRNFSQGAAQKGRGGGNVAEQEAQHGGHVGLDHARALGDAGQCHVATADAQRAPLELRHRVGGHDGARRAGQALRLDSSAAAWANARANLGHGQRLADHAGRSHQHVFARPLPARARRLRRHARGVAPPACAHRHVRDPAVDGDGARRCPDARARGTADHTGAPTTAGAREDSRHAWRACRSPADARSRSDVP